VKHASPHSIFAMLHEQNPKLFLKFRLHRNDTNKGSKVVLFADPGDKLCFFYGDRKRFCRLIQTASAYSEFNGTRAIPSKLSMF
jgi:hypothetical protein